jgi:prolyl-tRNA editing enzyme YbaK/EbsC (Cys-tRNA(Pro) deacylase)
MIDPELTGFDRLREALRVHGLKSRFESPGTPMPTVPLAAEAIGCSVDQIIKTVVFVACDGQPVIGIANGNRQIDRVILANTAGVESLRLASAELVLAVTGYPAKGVSPIGIRDGDARVFIDLSVLEQGTVFGGAGTEMDLIELRTEDLLRLNVAIVGAITQSHSPTPTP